MTMKTYHMEQPPVVSADCATVTCKLHVRETLFGSSAHSARRDEVVRWAVNKQLAVRNDSCCRSSLPGSRCVDCGRQAFAKHQH